VRSGSRHGIGQTRGYYVFSFSGIRTRLRGSRGQALTEFALVLPVLLVIVLGGLDFGRIFLGWINVQSMARIAANYAANDPTAWGAAPSTTSQAKYRAQILADATASNCTLPTSGGAPAIPAPSFTDVGGNGIGLGDTANVRITCTFKVITPVISSVVGGTLSVSADATFPVKAGMSAVAGGGGGGGAVAPSAAFLGNLVVANTSTTPTISGTGPFAVDFRDSSGGAPTAWSWTFGDGGTFGAQDPLVHTFTCLTLSCTYNVVMTASNAQGSASAHMTVVVVTSTTVEFSANRTSGVRPLAVTFTDASTPGGTTYAWTFGDGGTGINATAAHTYLKAGTYSVTLTVTYPSPTGAKALTKTNYITVGFGTCTVPSLNGVRINDAQALWDNKGFVGTVLRGTGAPNGNFQITSQSLVASQVVECNNDITVNG